MKGLSVGAGLLGLATVGIAGMLGCDPEIMSTRYRPEAHPTAPPVDVTTGDDGESGSSHPTVWDGSDHEGSGSALLSFTGQLSNRRFRLMRKGPGERGDAVTYQFSFDMEGEPWLLEMTPHRYGFLWTSQGTQVFELEVWHRAEDWVLISERAGNGEGLVIEFREQWDGSVRQQYTYYPADGAPVVLHSRDDFEVFLSASELNLHHSVAQEIAFEVLFHPAFQSYMAAESGSERLGSAGSDVGGEGEADRTVPGCFIAIRKVLAAGTMVKCAAGGPANALCDFGVALTAACLVTEAIWTLLPEPPEPPEEEGEGEDPPPPGGRPTSDAGVHPFNPLERARRGTPLGQWRVP